MSSSSVVAAAPAVVTPRTFPAARELLTTSPPFGCELAHLDAANRLLYLIPEGEWATDQESVVEWLEEHLKVAQKSIPVEEVSECRSRWYSWLYRRTFFYLQAIVGSVGVAFFDGEPFRAEVTKAAVFNSGPTVRFVDFGNEAIVPFLGEEEEKYDKEQGW